MARIVVVDDDPMMLKVCTNMLRRGQHQVLEAAGGQEALQLLRGTPVELALLDVIMPGMNGIELAARIQEASPTTRILLMTGYGPKEIAQVAGKENPHRIIWKPFKTESLLQMIDNILAAS